MTKKDMELYYKSDGFSCETKCPFKMKEDRTIIRVGSIRCAKCDYYKGSPKGIYIIYCQKQGELKEREAKHD